MADDHLRELLSNYLSPEAADLVLETEDAWLSAWMIAKCKKRTHIRSRKLLGDCQNVQGAVSDCVE